MGFISTNETSWTASDYHPGMDTQQPICIRCNQVMEAGFLIDHGYGAAYPPAWVAGAPEWSRWSGLKLKGRPKLPVTSYRCPTCGRLETYARHGKWPA